MKNLPSGFSQKEIRTIMEMLRYIVDFPYEFQNEVHFLSGDGAVHFKMSRLGDEVAHRQSELTGSHSFVSKLETAQLIRMGPPIPTRFDKKGRQHGGQPNSFFFTPMALEMYRNRDIVDDAQVRKAIGRDLYQQHLRSDDGFLNLHIDAIAQELGVNPASVRGQSRILRDVEIFADVGPVNSASEFGPVMLTKDGLRWALGGFPDELLVGPQVNVTVHVNISNFIDEVQEAPLSDEERQEATELVTEIRTEPTLDRVSRLFELAANVQQLTPAVVRFVSENGAALLQYLPGI